MWMMSPRSKDERTRAMTGTACPYPSGVLSNDQRVAAANKRPSDHSCDVNPDMPGYEAEVRTLGYCRQWRVTVD